jgi:uncharacterized protein (DUF3820 family)
MALEDTDKMPYGKFAGKEMQDVPASYLMWLYEEKKCTGEVLTYIIDNLDALKTEINAKNN